MSSFVNKTIPVSLYTISQTLLLPLGSLVPGPSHPPAISNQKLDGGHGEAWEQGWVLMINAWVLYQTGSFVLGYMLSVTQFPDQFREEVYWVSESGELLGMLPCLGAGPRSFLSATLNPRPSSGSMAATSQYRAMEEKDLEEEEEDSGGHYVFFNDGQGGICCIRN